MTLSFRHRVRWSAVAAATALLLTQLGCSSDDTTTPTPGPAGGPVSGPADAHCGGKKQPTTEAACHAGAGGGGTGGAGTGGVETGGHGTGGAMEMDEYGATLFNAEGDDDECKYHVSFTSTPIRQSEDVTFTVTAKKTADGTAAAEADMNSEVFLDETHPAPNSGVTTSETSPGVYSIGPIRFDAAGRWTVRFHLYEDCVDGEESPHGHVAFFVDVP